MKLGAHGAGLVELVERVGDLFGVGGANAVELREVIYLSKRAQRGHASILKARDTREVLRESGVLVEGDDLPNHGERVWLKGYGCVRYDDGEFVVTGDDIDAVREEGVDVIHWVPADHTVSITMRTPDGDVTGQAEPAFADTAVDELIQFERIGFVRVDEHADSESVVYYAHD